MDNQPVTAKFIPWPIKLLSVLNYFFTGLAWLSGIWFIFLGDQVGRFLARFVPQAEALGPIFFGVLGIICIVVGFGYFFVARGLWKGKKWTKTLYIVISAMGVISAILSVIDGKYLSLISLALYTLLFWYLLFNQTAKDAFK
jgi:hypothetical protein